LKEQLVTSLHHINFWKKFHVLKETEFCFNFWSVTIHIRSTFPPTNCNDDHQTNEATITINDGKNKVENNFIAWTFSVPCLKHVKSTQTTSYTHKKPHFLLTFYFQTQTHTHTPHTFEWWLCGIMDFQLLLTKVN